MKYADEPIFVFVKYLKFFVAESESNEAHYAFKSKAICSRTFSLWVSRFFLDLGNSCWQNNLHLTVHLLAVLELLIISHSLQQLPLAVWLLWCWLVGQSTTLVQTEISRQLFDGLAQNLVQTFLVPRWWILMNLVIPWLFYCHHEIEVLSEISQQLLDG